MSIDFDGIRERHLLVDVAARYMDLKRKGNEYVGLCVFHSDKNPSFSIYRGRDGTQRFFCHACQAGVDGSDVIDFVAKIEGVSLGDAARKIDGGEMPMPDTRPVRVLPPDMSSEWDPIVPVPRDAPPYDPARTFNPKSGEWKCYRPAFACEWREPTGGLIGNIVRLEFNGQKICPVITYCEGPGGEKRWCAKRPKPPYPLVGVEQLIDRPKATVIVVEGEKKRAACARELPDFVVVSLFGGAEAVKVMDLEPLKGRNVVVWPDADPVGRRAMRQVGEALK